MSPVHFGYTCVRDTISDVHCRGASGTWLLYRDFAEVLVRLAQARYRNLCSLPARVAALLADDLLLDQRSMTGAGLQPGEMDFLRTCLGSGSG